MANKIAAFGEVMQRLTVPNYLKLEQTTILEVGYTGTGVNVLGNLSQFGHQTKIITKLPDNGVGRAANRALKALGIDTTAVIIGGDRLGQYFLENGYGSRQSVVTYNRKGSSFLNSSARNYDWELLFKDVTQIHFCGISFLVSENMRAIALEAIHGAVSRGIKVSLDFNYREGLLSKKLARPLYEQLLPLVDFVFANHRDFTELLALTNYDLASSYEQNIARIMQTVLEKYPNISTIAGTKRTIISAKVHQLNSFIVTKKQQAYYASENFDVLERIGGGDAFVAGVLHGLKTFDTIDDTIKFATQNAIHKHTIIGDTNYATEEEIKRCMNQKAIKDIKR
ncbi:MAG: sugar kinase [Culicoidibacterales bacterium]